MGPIATVPQKAQAGVSAPAQQPAAPSAGPEVPATQAATAAVVVQKPPSRSILGLLPSGPRRNPFANLQFEPLQCAGMQVAKAFKAHAMGIAHIVLHPRKPIVVRHGPDSGMSSAFSEERCAGNEKNCAGLQSPADVAGYPQNCMLLRPRGTKSVPHPMRCMWGCMQATASDDCTWRMWQLPESELVMAGEGHKDWVAGLDFHPGGACLASSSGDATVKLWDFAEQRCAATLTEHTAAVWAVSFHDAGEVLASCSLDQTIRLWDVATASLKTVRPCVPLQCVGPGIIPVQPLDFWAYVVTLCS